MDAGMGAWNTKLMHYSVQTLLLSFLSTHFPYGQNVPFFPKALLTHPSVIQESHMVGVERRQRDYHIHGIHTQGQANTREDVKIPTCGLFGKYRTQHSSRPTAFKIPCTKASSALAPIWSL